MSLESQGRKCCSTHCCGCSPGVSIYLVMMLLTLSIFSFLKKNLETSTEELIRVTEQSGNIIHQKAKAETVTSGCLWMQTGGWRWEMVVGLVLFFKQNLKLCVWHNNFPKNWSPKSSGFRGRSSWVSCLISASSVSGGKSHSLCKARALAHNNASHPVSHAVVSWGSTQLANAGISAL